MLDATSVPDLPLDAVQRLYGKLTDWASVTNKDAAYAATTIQCYAVGFVPDAGALPPRAGILSHAEAADALVKHLEPITKNSTMQAINVPWAAILQLIIQLLPLILSGQEP